MALAGGRLVPQGLYDRAVKVLGHESVTDMIVLMGYYTAVSLTMNFYAVPAGSSRPGPLSRRAMAHVRITPLHPSLGAEVAGVDLSAPIDEPTRDALTRALADHLALVFHDQSLTPAQYLAAAVGVRAADGAALLAAQHARTSP